MRTLLAFLLSALVAVTSVDAKKPRAKAWTDPEVAAKEHPDFLIQGEYLADDETYGVQVVALGNNAFDAYVLEGGLPGAGWEPEKLRVKLSGKTEGDVVVFPEVGKGLGLEIKGQSMTLKTADKTQVSLKRVERKSPTLGAKPIEGATVLFDGTSTDAWDKGVIKDGLLGATSCTTKQEFGSYHLHLEFRTPYTPDARGQKRGNSGVYHSGRWETQILDSFALESRDNHCGGIYSVSKPKLNMCLPPLAWQTYDVDFTAAKFDAEGNRTAWPRITVRLNGVLVHEDLELPKNFTTSAPITSEVTHPKGPVHLQNHNDPVVYRNIWIVEK